MRLLKRVMQAAATARARRSCSRDTTLLPTPGEALDNVNTPEEREAMQLGLETLA